MKSNQVLVVEDSDAKFRNIKIAVKQTSIADVEITRASTAVEAEQQILKGPWTLIILDMSLNITGSSLGSAIGGHATLGGLQIVEKMYLLDQEWPTVIVTAFDAFQAHTPADLNNSIVGLEYIEANAARLLGKSYLGCVRYSEPGWATVLQDIFCKRILKNEDPHSA